jgi:hypothetical protein
MADQTEMAHCAMCTNAGTLSRSGCHDIQYCSKDYQKTNWPLHKLFCRIWTYSVRPYPDMVRGIWSSEKDKPRFVWHKHELLADGRVQNIMATVNTLENRENMTGMSVYHVLVRSAIEYLDRPIAPISEGKRIYLSMGPTGRGTAKKLVGLPTKAFSKIDKELAGSMRGRIFAHGFVPAENKFVDLTMKDLRHVVDFYR